MANEEQKQEGRNKGEPASSTLKTLIALAVVGGAIVFGVSKCTDAGDKAFYETSIREGTYKGFSVRRDIAPVTGYIGKRRVIIYDEHNRERYLVGKGVIGYSCDIHGNFDNFVDEGWYSVDLSHVPKGDFLGNLANVSDLEGAWNSATNKPIAKGFWEKND
jgi:hypothetical protein